MNPLDTIFMLDGDAKMDKATMKLVRIFQTEKKFFLEISENFQVKEQGHSRIPVYFGERKNVKSLLLVKSLLFVNLKAGISVSNSFLGN